MVATRHAELVADAKAELGEGPVWDARLGRLVWTDITGSAVHLTDPASGDDEVVRVDQQVGALVPRRDHDGYVVAARGGFGMLDLDLDETGDGVATVDLVWLADYGPGVRMNDGKCDDAGRFWAGTIADDFRPGAATLYRFDPDRSVTRVLEGLTISNGMAWSADTRSFFFVDSPTGRVDVYDHDAERSEISHRRTFADIPGPGVPDGMTIDDEGCLWVAVWGGGEVRRFTPSGALDLVVEMPVPKPTSCTFGGPDLDVLFITSAADGDASGGLAGGLFGCHTGHRGLPAHRFAG